jgi:hypothetical protein
VELFSNGYPIRRLAHPERQDGPMKSSVMLNVTSGVSILLLSIHIAEDIVLCFSGGGLTDLFGIAVS